MVQRAEQEIASGQRFAFGDNWWRFLDHVDVRRIAAAEAALHDMLGGPGALSAARFLDVGCGSGLMSLAAANLGAQVTSFDFDPRSVACARELKRRYRPEDDRWTILEGSALDRPFVQGLGTFDVMYSWGVLHHTGAMWDAIGIAADTVREGGLLFIAIYNDQGRNTARWVKLKRLYNRAPLARPVITALAAVRLVGPTLLRDTMAGDPMRQLRTASERGMSLWIDVVDWVGGWPFEAAKPDDVIDFVRDRGFVLERLRTVGGGLGCNQFVFRCCPQFWRRTSG